MNPKSCFQLRRRLEARNSRKNKDEKIAEVFSLGERQKTSLENMRKVNNCLKLSDTSLLYTLLKI